MRHNLVNSIGRTGVSFHCDMENFALLCYFGKRSLTTSGKDVKCCLADTFDANYRSSIGVSEDENILDTNGAPVVAMERVDKTAFHIYSTHG